MAVAPEASRVVLAPQASETAEQLFQEHSGWIYGYCLRLLRSPEEAEDALQTTYLNACRSLNQGTRPKVGSAWLLRIAQNVCFARLRSSSRRGKLERVQDFTVLEETVAAPERTREELIGLIDALATLPERQRKAILLREWQGLSHREVAHRLGMTQAAVETLIFRARRSLATALEDPGKRPRRRRLHALDLGGLLAATKGFFSGAAGVKVVAAIAVATATTATVVATDPVGVWRDRQPRVAVQAEAPAPKSPVATARSLSSPPAAAPARESAATGGPSTPVSERGRAFGQATAAAATAKSNGNGKGKAYGLTKKEAATPKSSNGRGIHAGGRPESPQENGPPPHAKAKGLEKDRLPKPPQSH